MTKTLATLALIACLGLFAGCTPSGDGGGEAEPADTDTGGGEPTSAEVFASSVEPIIQENCVNCHGGDQTKAGLVMTSLDSLMTGGDSGSPVTAGDADGSLIVQVIEGTHADIGEMPPKDGPLAAEEIAAIRSWISGM